MSSVKIFTSIHVPTDCDVSMRTTMRKSDNKKYAVLSIGNATIFIDNHKKALEIADLLEQAAKELENKNDPKK